MFHNEAWSTLLRSVHSIIRYSPRELVEEILLVDDASDREYLGKKLDDHMANLPFGFKGRVLRMEKRSGLIKARLKGAAEAKAPVLTFLDAVSFGRFVTGHHCGLCGFHRANKAIFD